MPDCILRHFLHGNKLTKEEIDGLKVLAFQQTKPAEAIILKPLVVSEELVVVKLSSLFSCFMVERFTKDPEFLNQIFSWCQRTSTYHSNQC